ncbi:urease subunit beta [Lederbergia citrea]|uniref:Urease subunit beta n=1 Tax=Lederbergia citrea TaxID=2833581 RepID=A0A942Z3V7_9BACI|nr:urease subunit beta [Lederbergia citrea]MBS4178493.1 urease subunit beta [Lederbergia citrea]MBS4205164.1 urease subunit beta [Lederbergia citrea]MBS4222974.1 urease subunit beta [Lederbergia citrea]
MKPGEYVLMDEDIICNEGKDVKKISVINKGDRPVQVGSHFHFYEVNEALDFTREDAFGFRLNVPAGSAVRFEPGDPKEVELVALGGERKVYGLNEKTEGSVDRRNK